MSDDEEYEYDYGSDEDYNQCSDDDENGDMPDEMIEMENSFFEAEDIRHENPSKALELFEKVITMEENLGDDVKWRFKAMQHLVTIYFAQGIYNNMLSRYRGMLDIMSSVTRNECTDAINIILDAIATSTDVSVLSQMYEITLEALKNANNERLWFNTNQKLAKLYIDAGKIEEVENILRILKQSCEAPDGSDDIANKGASLLEIYCLEIQLCSFTQNVTRLRVVYPKTMNLGAATVADPRLLGIIREEGGKMFMMEGNWDEAYNELYEAFRNYQEAGNPRARDCLKYVVLASMLALTDINPFDAREAKVFAEDKEILAMRDLRQSLESNDLKRFEKIVANRQNRIADEPLLMTYMKPLRKRMQEQVLLNMVGPYSTMSLQFLSQELLLGMAEVECLVVGLIADGRLENTYIDQIKQCIIFHAEALYMVNDNVGVSLEDKKVLSLSQWGKGIDAINSAYKVDANNEKPISAGPGRQMRSRR